MGTVAYMEFEGQDLPEVLRSAADWISELGGEGSVVDVVTSLDEDDAWLITVYFHNYHDHMD